MTDIALLQLTVKPRVYYSIGTQTANKNSFTMLQEYQHPQRATSEFARTPLIKDIPAQSIHFIYQQCISCIRYHRNFKECKHPQPVYNLESFIQELLNYGYKQ